MNLLRKYDQACKRGLCCIAMRVQGAPTSCWSIDSASLLLPRAAVLWRLPQRLKGLAGHGVPGGEQLHLQVYYL